MATRPGREPTTVTRAAGSARFPGPPVWRTLPGVTLLQADVPVCLATSRPTQRARPIPS